MKEREKTKEQLFKEIKAFKKHISMLERSGLERKKTSVEFRKHAQDLEKLNDRIREAMNQIQEKDQRLLDASEELKAANEELIATNEELAVSRDELEAQKAFILAERDRLGTVIRQMGEGVIVINEKNEIELMNQRAKEMLGYGLSEEMPLSYKKFLVLQLWKELHESNKKVVKKELKLQRPREATLMVSLAQLSKEEKGFVSVMRDITYEKEIEKMKSDFVANVSHEIRSPMAPMKDALSLVLDGTAGPLSEQQNKFLTILKNNMDRLTRLINDLLDLSKIEAGRMELKKELINISYLAKETIDSISVYAQRKNIELFFQGDEDLPQINCDKDRITQVIINLVMNAIKFTPEGGNVSVVVTRDEGRGMKDEGRRTKDDGRMRPSSVVPRPPICVSVADTGPGMSQDELDVLFNRFKQLASPERVKGTGLGLSISKAIVEMHGGSIKIKSEVGKGSTFSFMLPV